MSGFQIPFTGTKRQYQSLRSELLDTADKVWSTGQHLNGYYTETFESVIAERCNRKYAIAVNSGTQALIFAIRSLNLPFRSKIAIPGLSFVATLNSIIETGYIPHLIDVDKDGLIDLTTDEDIEKTYDALVYVNLYGNMVDYSKIKLITEFFGQITKLPVIEDAAQSFGSTFQGKPSGSFGDISILSFDPMKNFNSYGSGGMVLTDDMAIASSVRDLATNGKENNYSHSGTNSRMSELDCACMLVKLGHFDKWQARRKKIATYWNDEFNNHIRTLVVHDDVESSYHKYPIFVNPNVTSRNRLKYNLQELGIATKVHYDKALGNYQSFIECAYSIYDADLRAGIEHQATQTNMAVTIANNQLSLPIYPELTDAEVEFIAEQVKDNASKY